MNSSLIIVNTFVNFCSTTILITKEIIEQREATKYILIFQKVVVNASIVLIFSFVFVLIMVHQEG